MNANDVLRGYELHTAEGGRLTEEDAVIVAALKLKAAAESNDGTTPETDAVNDSMAGAQGWVTYTPMAPLARRLERERNGLAARVRELEQFQLERQSAEYLDAERYRYLRNRADEQSDGPIICSGLGDNFDFLRGLECDEEIDAARSKP